MRLNTISVFVNKVKKWDRFVVWFEQAWEEAEIDVQNIDLRTARGRESAAREHILRKLKNLFPDDL